MGRIRLHYCVVIDNNMLIRFYSGTGQVLKMAYHLIFTANNVVRKPNGGVGKLFGLFCCGFKCRRA